MKANSPLRSGDLAKLAGISPDTLRLYERKGLITSPRSPNGYRSYPQDAMAQVQLIRAALSIGFTLDELAEILAVRNGGGAPCRRVRELAGVKLKNLDEHIRELGHLRSQLRATLKQWDATLKKTPRSKRAGLLEALADSGAASRRLSPQIYSSLAGKMTHKEPRK